MGARTRPFRPKARAFSVKARVARQRASIVTRTVNPALNAITIKSRRATLVYKSFLNLSTQTGVGDQIVSCNGLFDPDITGAGHQPAGFDQYMDFYDHYEVLSSKIVVKVISPEVAATANQLIALVAIRDAPTAITLTTIDDTIENGLSAWGVSGSGASTGSNGVMTLQNSFVKSSFFGNRGGDTLVGSISSNPAEQAFFIIKVASAAEGNTSTATMMHYEVHYDVIFTERKRVLSS